MVLAFTFLTSRRLRLAGLVGSLTAETENFFGAPQNVGSGKFRLLGDECIQNAQRQHRRATRGGMQLVGLEQRAGFAGGQGQAVRVDGGVGHRVAHEFRQRHDDDLRVRRRPLPEPPVGRFPRGCARHHVHADDTGVGRVGGVGNVTDDEGRMDLFQQFQALFQSRGAGGVGAAIAVAEPEQKIHADDERGPVVCGGGDLQRREGFGIQEQQRTGEIFYRCVRRGDGGVEIIIQFAPGGGRPAQRLGQNKSRRRARTDDDHARPRGIGGAHWQLQNHDEQQQDF